MAATKIKVKDIIGKEIATNPQDGEKLFGVIERNITVGNIITVDFEDIKLLISAFLNKAIGKLFERHTPDEIEKFVLIEGLTKEDMDLIKLVKDRSITYYKNRDDFDKTIQEILGE